MLFRYYRIGKDSFVDDLFDRIIDNERCNFQIFYSYPFARSIQSAMVDYYVSGFESR